MGFNAYKEFDKIKKLCKGKEDKEGKISIDDFAIAVMTTFGTGRKKTTEWINNFEEVGFIERIKDFYQNKSYIKIKV